MRGKEYRKGSVCRVDGGAICRPIGLVPAGNSFVAASLITPTGSASAISCIGQRPASTLRDAHRARIAGADELHQNWSRIGFGLPFDGIGAARPPEGHAAVADSGRFHARQALYGIEHALCEADALGIR